MGSSSIQSFFGCAGFRSLHYRCDRATTCAECVWRSVVEGGLPLSRCGKAEVYSQVDGTVGDHRLYLPQVELLEGIVRGYPDATFILPFRSMDRWYHSISNWPPGTGFDRLRERLLRANVTGLPSSKRGSLRDFSDFFCGHVRAVRDVVPPQRLVEIDIEDPAAGARLGDVFDLDADCWGRANVNVGLHPELNQTRGEVEWFIHGKIMLRGKDGVLRHKRDLPPLPLFNVSRGMEERASVLGMEPAENNITAHRSEERTAPPNKRTVESVQEKMHHEEPIETSLRNDCEELYAHENGHWHHTANPDPEQKDARQMYFPQEITWLSGQQTPDFGQCMPSDNFLMYGSALGHQCGCGATDFSPTHSTWVYNTTQVRTPAAAADVHARSPTLRLARRLADAGATLCFAGDSVDYQLYAAFHNNLRRIDQLQKLYRPGEERLVSVVTREIPVKHATRPGNISDWSVHGHRPPDGDGSFLNARRPPPGGFGSLFSISETKALFKFNGTAKKARIRYYMSYGWSPWNADVMEDCNVIIMNLGLHYSPDGNHAGRITNHSLMADMLAAITYLSNFTASGNSRRVAVWRSALPQHFSTEDGHFRGWKNLQGSCTDLSTTAGSARRQQVYNEVYEEAFAKLCQFEPRTGERSGEPCRHSRHQCKVNPVAEVEYQTIYKFWQDNNCTENIEREWLRLASSHSTKEEPASVTGRILGWNIFDLFDERRWHTTDLDCTHFCYVPPLFEAAFERLELLLSPLLASFSLLEKE